jgi:hypothetical protein
MGPGWPPPATTGRCGSGPSLVHHSHHCVSRAACPTLRWCPRRSQPPENMAPITWHFALGSNPHRRHHPSRHDARTHSRKRDLLPAHLRTRNHEPRVRRRCAHRPLPPARPARASTAARPRAASGTGPAGRRVGRQTQLRPRRRRRRLDPIEPNSATTIGTYCGVYLHCEVAPRSCGRDRHTARGPRGPCSVASRP